MESLEIARLLREAFPQEVLDIQEFRGQTAVLLRHCRILDVLVYVREHFDMMHLRSLCGVDNSRRKQEGLGAFEVVYNLYSVNQRSALRLRAQLDDPDAGIDSAVPLWPVANWLEREVFDLMGIHFKGHPDLRRILLPDDWQGHPLRKAYPVRIPSRGVPEWSGLTELREHAKAADALSWQGEKSMSEIRKQSLECPVRHGQPVGRQNVQELLGRELPENADDFDCFDESDEDRTSLRLGPQHPATHGVLRLDLELEGETILSCDPQVGYLHRGFEKMAETFTYAQALTLTDRLDYIAAMSNNTGYCLAVEKLLGVQAPLRARYIRTIACEMSRLCSHLLWLATHALDIGAMTVFLYCFREREMLLDLFEDLCGARLTLTYPRIGGVRQDVTGRFMEGLQDFLNIFPKRILEYETLLDTNRIWLQRTVGVGVLSGEEALALGLTGACLRGSGVDYDVRKHEPYDAYDLVDFEVPLGSDGDIYARYRCRMEEMRQSVRILQQCVDQLPPGATLAADAPDLLMPYRAWRSEAETALFGGSLRQVMHDNNIYMPGDVYVATEAPKGELGFYFVSDGSSRPYRMHVRGPSFIHIGALASIAPGGLIADLIANIGSMDVVLGESDR